VNLLSGAADTSEQMREPWFDFPINPLDEVVPGLWQASSELDPPELFARGFDAIFDLGDRPRGHSVPGRAYVYYRIEDVPSIEDPSVIDALAEQVASRVQAGERVVVNCAAGLNRSGLLVGRALIALGHAPSDAIDLVRRARGSHALCNQRFAAWLLEDCSPRGTPRRVRGHD